MHTSLVTLITRLAPVSGNSGATDKGINVFFLPGISSYSLL